MEWIIWRTCSEKLFFVDNTRDNIKIHSSSSCIKVNISNVWTSNGQLVFWFVSRSGFENVSLELVEQDFRSESRKMAPLPNVKLKNNFNNSLWFQDSFKLRTLYLTPLEPSWGQNKNVWANVWCMLSLNFIPFFGENGENTWIILVPKPWINIIFCNSK